MPNDFKTDSEYNPHLNYQSECDIFLKYNFDKLVI